LQAGAWHAEQRDFMARSRAELECRYHDAMGAWISQLKPWYLFARSLTFDPLDMAAAGRAREGIRSEKVELDQETRRRLLVPALTFATAQRHLDYFVNAASGVLGRPTYSVGALEPHKSGQPHGHLVVSIEGGLKYGDIKALHRLWRSSRGNGSIYLVEPKSRGDVAGYCAKYLAKDLSELVMSRSLDPVQALRNC
jgi:hypothetical protein